MEEIPQTEYETPIVLDIPRISSRRLEILQLIERGLTDKEIAVQLGISHRTVRNQLCSDIYPALGVTTRTAAVYTARRLGLLAEIRLRRTTVKNYAIIHGCAHFHAESTGCLEAVQLPSGRWKYRTSYLCGDCGAHFVETHIGHERRAYPRPTGELGTRIDQAWDRMRHLRAQIEGD